MIWSNKNKRKTVRQALSIKGQQAALDATGNKLQPERDKASDPQLAAAAETKRARKLARNAAMAAKS